MEKVHAESAGRGHRRMSWSCSFRRPFAPQPSSAWMSVCHGPPQASCVFWCGTGDVFWSHRHLHPEDCLSEGMVLGLGPSPTSGCGLFKTPRNFWPSEKQLMKLQYLPWERRWRERAAPGLGSSERCSTGGECQVKRLDLGSGWLWR